MSLSKKSLYRNSRKVSCVKIQFREGLKEFRQPIQFQPMPLHQMYDNQENVEYSFAKALTTGVFIYNESRYWVKEEFKEIFNVIEEYLPEIYSWDLKKRIGWLSLYREDSEQALDVRKFEEYLKSSKHLKVKSRHIQRYSEDVLNWISDEKIQALSSQIHYGIELESDNSNLNVGSIIPMLNYGILAHDSTVEVEFKSVPLTFSEVEEFISECNYSLGVYLGDNYKETTGMHVHVSRKFLTPSQIENIQVLMNLGDNQEYWCSVAKRDLKQNYWAGFSDPDSPPSSRLHVVNFQNGATVEFRMFKSPTSAKEVLENVRIVKAILEFSKSDSEMSYQAFKKFSGF